MEKKKIASLGYVLKEEKIGTVEQFNFSNLVLEGKKPFPGFYEHLNTPGAHRKKSFIFLVLNPVSSPTIDKILRASQTVKERLGFEYNIRPAEVYLYNKRHKAVRLIIEDNSIEDYNNVDKLFVEYGKEGLSFLKAKKIDDYSSIIKIINFFELEEEAEGIFKDLNSSHKAYLQIPAFDNWEVFKKISVIVRNSVAYKSFDAALGSIYQAGGLWDYARIYSDEYDLSKLSELRKKFIEEIDRKRF